MRYMNPFYLNQYLSYSDYQYYRMTPTTKSNRIYNYTFSSFYYKVQGIVSSYHFSYQQGEKEPEHSSFHFPGEQQPLSQID